MDRLVQRPAAPPAADRSPAQDQHQADPAAEVLRLFHDEELDLAQVARRTGVSRAGVRAILRDAMPEQAQHPLSPRPATARTCTTRACRRPPESTDPTTNSLRTGRSPT